MSREWTPGDVAMVTLFDHKRIAIVRPRKTAVDADLEFAYVTGGFDMVDDLADGCSARPLVVIDPEAIPMDDLLRALDRWQHWSSLTHEQVVVKALFDQIAGQTAPPKPDEPTGLGAVVEDAEGNLWVNSHRVTAWVNRDMQPRSYANIAAVKVLSEGVTP